jgi:hypothetical protein
MGTRTRDLQTFITVPDATTPQRATDLLIINIKYLKRSNRDVIKILPRQLLGVTDEIHEITGSGYSVLQLQ